ncbi:hypothetical protein ACI8AC_06235 [Geodermatophilus sp. SYSU D00758]
MAAWLDEQDVDIWLLTEVHRDGDPRGRKLAVWPPRGFGPDHQRWAGIATTLPSGTLRTVGDPGHAGEEGLSLARLVVDIPGSTVLVACSVLPWKDPGESWPGLPSGGHATQLRHVLDHHVARIAAERLPGEPIIWGGDFNQPLTEPSALATVEGARAVRAAFDGFGLVPLTERAEHLKPGYFAIDHLAVSAELVDGDPLAEVHRPPWEHGALSDHAAYIAEIRLSLPSAAVPPAKVRAGIG